VTVPFPEPTGPPVPRAEVLLGYLDYFRSLVVSKVQGLSDAQLRVSLLPSGWTVIELDRPRPARRPLILSQPPDLVLARLAGCLPISTARLSMRVAQLCRHCTARRVRLINVNLEVRDIGEAEASGG